MESLWGHFKNSKTTRDAIHPSIHTYQKYLNPSRDPVPLRIMYITWWFDGMDADLVHARLHHVVEEHGPEVRVVDPDSHWIRIQSGQWIRIQEGKNNPQKVEKIKKFHVLKC